MIGYVTLGTNDLAAARRFYDQLFDVIGIGRMIELPTLTAWGASWETPMLAVAAPFDGAPASAGNGTMVALVQKCRADVDRLRARALEQGGADEGAPGVRGAQGGQHFYAAYWRDPDGNKLSAVHVGPG
jgi:catechol 2,3-dioxygenase-like lactoylglutathione lyase family enzyme